MYIYLCIYYDNSRVWPTFWQGCHNLVTTLHQPCDNLVSTLPLPCTQVVTRLIKAGHNVVNTWYKNGCTTLWQGCHNLVFSIWDWTLCQVSVSGRWLAYYWSQGDFYTVWSMPKSSRGKQSGTLEVRCALPISSMMAICHDRLPMIHNYRAKNPCLKDVKESAVPVITPDPVLTCSQLNLGDPRPRNTKQTSLKSRRAMETRFPAGFLIRTTWDKLFGKYQTYFLLHFLEIMSHTKALISTPDWHIYIYICEKSAIQLANVGLAHARPNKNPTIYWSIVHIG